MRRMAGGSRMTGFVLIARLRRAKQRVRHRAASVCAVQRRRQMRTWLGPRRVTSTSRMW